MNGYPGTTPPQREERIVWVKPSARTLPYVREGIILHMWRSRRPRFPGLVAYAENEKTAAPYHRRVWWLKVHDPYQNGAPAEAVDPRTIALNQPSRPVPWSELAQPKPEET